MRRRREKSAVVVIRLFCEEEKNALLFFLFFFVSSKIEIPFIITRLMNFLKNFRERERERNRNENDSRQNIVLKSSSSRENKVPFSRLKKSRRHGSLDDHKKGAGGESPKERRLVFCLLDFLLAFCALFFFNALFSLLVFWCFR